MTHDGLTSIYNALEKFWALNSDMPLQQAMIFLAVAQSKESLTLTELCKRIDGKQSTISRSIIALTDRAPHDGGGRSGKGALDLLRQVRDPNDYRRWLIQLTPKGRAFIKSISE